MEYVYTDDAECCGWLTKIGSLIRHVSQGFYVSTRLCLLILSETALLAADEEGSSSFGVEVHVPW